MPQIGVVADDLTGASTIGVLLARSQAKTEVFFYEDAVREVGNVQQLDAVVISTNSRNLPGEDAYQKVASATKTLQDLGVQYFTKRIDTTLRGDIGMEIDAMLDQMAKKGDHPLALVVPAMPQSRRILVGGYSIIDGMALTRTPAAQDIHSPVTESYIPRLLEAQTKRKVGLISLDAVLQGVEGVKEALMRERDTGTDVIVVDSITFADVETVARAAISLGSPILAVDPGPFTTRLAYCRGLIQKEQSQLLDMTREPNKTVLVAAGSASQVTGRQLAVLCEDERIHRISVDPCALISGGEIAKREIRQAQVQADSLLHRDPLPRALVFETAQHGILLDLEAEEQKHGLPKGTAGDRINEGLGELVAQVLEQAGRQKIAGLYTTGGDTMVQVCEHLGVSCIETKDYVIPQADVGRLVGNFDGLPIIGKGGLTGDDHTAVDIVNRLFQEAAFTP